MKIWHGTFEEFSAQCDPVSPEMCGQLYLALRASRENLGLERKTLAKKITAVGNNIITGPKLQNMASGKTTSDNVVQILFYLYTRQVGFCISHPGYKNPKLKEKPIWEIVIGAPVPSGPEINYYLESLKIERAQKTQKRNNLKDKPPETSPQSIWKLTPLDKRSVNDEAYNFNLDDAGQRPLVGNPVSVVVDMTIRTQFAENGIGFGFNVVRLITSIKSEAACSVSYNLEYSTPQPARLNGVARHEGGRTSGYLELTAFAGSSLDGTYSLYDLSWFSVTPHEEIFEFDADLRVKLYDMTLVGTDGIPHLSDTKQAVIRSLLAAELIDFNAVSGSYVLCRQTFKIHPWEPIFATS